MVRLELRVATLAVVPALALATACSGSPSVEDRRAALADDLVTETDGGLDQATADCVAGALFDELGDGAPAAVLAAERSGDDDVRLQVIDAFSRCDAVAPALGTG